jgi:hypothetical protein
MFLLCKGIKHELKEIRIIIHVKKSELLLYNGTIKPTSHQRKWMQKQEECGKLKSSTYGSIMF